MVVARHDGHAALHLHHESHPRRCDDTTLCDIVFAIRRSQSRKIVFTTIRFSGGQVERLSGEGSAPKRRRLRLPVPIRHMAIVKSYLRRYGDTTLCKIVFAIRRKGDCTVQFLLSSAKGRRLFDMCMPARRFGKSTYSGLPTAWTGLQVPSGRANASCGASFVRGFTAPEIVPNWEASACLGGCLKLPGSASPASWQEAAAPQSDDLLGWREVTGRVAGGRRCRHAQVPPRSVTRGGRVSDAC